MAKVTMRDFVRVICCLHLPAADESMEENTAEGQNDNDRIKPVSVARVIPELDGVPESRPATSRVAVGIRCGSASTNHLKSSVITASDKLLPVPSNNNNDNASTQTDFDDRLGQNSSQTSRHRTSVPKILRVGRAVLSSSVADKDRQAQCSKASEEQTALGQTDLPESQGGDVGEMQAAPTASQSPRENTSGQMEEVAGQYIAYR